MKPGIFVSLSQSSSQQKMANYHQNWKEKVLSFSNFSILVFIFAVEKVRNSSTREVDLLRISEVRLQQIIRTQKPRKVCRIL